ncbi:WD40 repeat domain-containing protein [Streptomyces sp. NPDC005263]|uniref:WD40 repeat domain-containing protein n=1 Tax=Streptomyces sp. NPDC005263 TaxID=3364711 RepID=UPI00367B6B4A
MLLGMRPWDRFHQLHELARHGGLLVDLDEADPKLEQDLVDYLDDVLTHVDGYHTGPARRLRETVAHAAAARLAHTPQQGEKWGEFLVASVFTSYLASTVVPPDIPSATRLGDSVPVTLPDVFELDLASRPTPETARALLVAIAHAKGNGIPAELAYPLAHAFHPTSDQDSFPQILNESMFYLRTHVDIDGTTLYRPFHQGLADHLRAHPHRAPASDTAGEPSGGAFSAARLVLAALLASHTNARHLIWANASPYLLRHAIEHALDADSASRLISDPEFLVYAEPQSLRAALSAAESGEAILAAAVYRTSLKHHREAHPETRRSFLALDASRFGAKRLQQELTEPLVAGSWRPRWATGGTLNSLLIETLTGHGGTVLAVACTVLDGQQVAVTGSADDTVRIWDLTSGQQLGQPLLGHEDSVFAVACTVLDGRPIAITGSADHTLRIWDLTSGQQLGQPLLGHEDSVFAVACTVLDGRPIAITGSADHTLRIWDLATRKPIGRPLTGHTLPVTAVACTVLDGRAIAVSGSRDSTVMIWDLDAREPIGRPLTGHTLPVTAVACTVLDGRAIAVSGSRDYEVRLWDLAMCEPLGEPLVGHAAPVCAVACSRDLMTRNWDMPVAVTASSDGSVQVWDLSNGSSVGKPLSSGADRRCVVACTVVDGRPVAITGNDYGTVGIWDLTSGPTVGEPMVGHSTSVWGAVCTVAEGRPVAVTSTDGMALVWDLETGAPIDDLTEGLTELSNRVADAVTGRPFVSSDSYNARLRGLSTSQPIAHLPALFPLLSQRDMACTVLTDGRSVAVSGSNDHAVRVWDLGSGECIGHLTGHTDAVNAIACTVLADGRSVAVSGSNDHAVRVWDLGTGECIGHLTGHTDAVNAIACTVLADGRSVAVSGSNDHAVRVWDLAGATCEVIPVTHPVTAVAVDPNGVLVIGIGTEIVVMERKRHHTGGGQ